MVALIASPHPSDQSQVVGGFHRHPCRHWTMMWCQCCNQKYYHLPFLQCVFPNPGRGSIIYYVCIQEEVHQGDKERHPTVSCAAMPVACLLFTAAKVWSTIGVGGCGSTSALFFWVPFSPILTTPTLDGIQY